jgi:hypothetical protein
MNTTFELIKANIDKFNNTANLITNLYNCSIDEIQALFNEKHIIDYAKTTNIMQFCYYNKLKNKYVESYLFALRLAILKQKDQNIKDFINDKLYNYICCNMCLKAGVINCMLTEYDDAYNNYYLRFAHKECQELSMLVENKQCICDNKEYFYNKNLNYGAYVIYDLLKSYNLEDDEISKISVELIKLTRK